MSSNTFDPNSVFEKNNGVVDQSNLTTFINLSVKLPKRVVDAVPTTFDNRLTYFMSGDDNNSFGTQYVDISFTNTEYGIKNKSLFGITNIDVSFDSSFHPLVDINFVDIKGSSLFNHMEQMSATSTSSAQSFFSSLFHFPYPQFVLTMKGYYGVPSSFDLKVMDFDAEFDGNTGYYNVRVKFIGDKYGVLSDIPMSILMLCPYQAKKNEDNSTFILEKRDDFDYKFRNLQKIPTFLEIVKCHAQFLAIGGQTNKDEEITINGKKITKRKIEAFASQIIGNEKYLSDYESIKQIQKLMEPVQTMHKEFIKKINGNKYDKKLDVIFNKEKGVYYIKDDGTYNEEIQSLYSAMENLYRTIKSLHFDHTEPEKPNILVQISDTLSRINSTNLYDMSQEHHINAVQDGKTIEDIENVYQTHRLIYECNVKTGKVKKVKRYGYDTSGYCTPEEHVTPLLEWRNDTYSIEPTLIFFCTKNDVVSDVSDKQFLSIKRNFTSNYTLNCPGEKRKSVKDEGDGYVHIRFEKTFYNRTFMPHSSEVKGPYKPWDLSCTTDIGSSLYFTRTKGTVINFDISHIAAMVDETNNKMKDYMRDYARQTLIYVIPQSLIFPDISDLVKKIKGKLEEIKKNSALNMLDFFNFIFGFKPTVGKISEIVFAHVDYFANKIMKNLIYDNCIKDKEKRQINTTLETDAKTVNNYIPPFTLFSKLTEDGYKKVYPADEIQEIKNENKIKNEYHDIRYIEGLYNTLRAYTKEIVKTQQATNPPDISFERMLPSDYLINGNPYDFNLLNIDENENIIDSILRKLANRVLLNKYYSNNDAPYTFIQDDYNKNIKPVLLSKSNSTAILNMSRSGNKLMGYIKELEDKKYIALDYDKLNKNFTEIDANSHSKWIPINNNNKARMFVLKQIADKDDKNASLHTHWMVDDKTVVMKITEVQIPESANGMGITYYASSMLNSLYEKNKEGGNSHPFEENGTSEYDEKLAVIDNSNTLKILCNTTVYRALLLGSMGDSSLDTYGIDSNSKKYLQDNFKKWAESKDEVVLFNNIKIHGFQYFFKLENEELTKNNVIENTNGELNTPVTFLFLKQSPTVSNKVNIAINTQEFQTKFTDRIKKDSGTASSMGEVGDDLTFGREAKTALYYQIKYFGDKYMYDVYNNMFVLGNEDGYIDPYNIKVFDSFMNNISNTSFVNVSTFITLINDMKTDIPSKSVLQFLSEVAESNKFLFLTLPINLPDRRDKIAWGKIFDTYPWSKESNDSGVKNSIVFFKSNEDSFLVSSDDFNNDFLTEKDISMLKINAFDIAFGEQKNNFFKSVNMNMDGSIATEESIANTLVLTSGGNLGKISHIKGGAMNLYDIYKARSYKVSVEMMGNSNMTPFMYFNLKNTTLFSGIYRVINVSHNITPNDFTTKITGVKVNKHLIPESSEIGSVYTLLTESFKTLLKVTTNTTTTSTQTRENVKFFDAGSITDDVGLYVKRVWEYEYEYKDFTSKEKVWQALESYTIPFSEQTDLYSTAKSAFTSVSLEAARVIGNILMCFFEIDKYYGYNSLKEIQINSAKRNRGGGSQHNHGFAMDLRAFGKTDSSTDKFTQESLKLSIVAAKFMHELHMVISEHNSAGESGYIRSEGLPQWVHIGVKEPSNYSSDIKRDKYENTSPHGYALMKQLLGRAIWCEPRRYYLNALFYLRNINTNNKINYHGRTETKDNRSNFGLRNNDFIRKYKRFLQQNNLTDYQNI